MNRGHCRALIVLAYLALCVGTARAQLSSKKVLTIASAKKIAQAAETEAIKRHATVAIVVVDEAGYPIYLERLDDAPVASIEVGIGKARTAAIFRRSTKVFEDQIRNGRLSPLAIPGATPLQGGLPIIVGGKVIGAIAVSGSTAEEDEEIAKAGTASMAEVIQ